VQTNSTLYMRHAHFIEDRLDQRTVGFREFSLRKLRLGTRTSNLPLSALSRCEGRNQVREAMRIYPPLHVLEDLLQMLATLVLAAVSGHTWRSALRRKNPLSFIFHKVWKSCGNATFPLATVYSTLAKRRAGNGFPHSPGQKLLPRSVASRLFPFAALFTMHARRVAGFWPNIGRAAREN